MENKPECLHTWSERMEGAKTTLLKLQYAGVCLEDELSLPKAERKVYSDAIYRLLITDKWSLSRWLERNDEIGFKNHERNNKGKLIRCEAYIIR